MDHILHLEGADTFSGLLRISININTKHPKNKLNTQNYICTQRPENAETTRTTPHQPRQRQRRKRPKKTVKLQQKIQPNLENCDKKRPS